MSWWMAGGLCGRPVAARAAVRVAGYRPLRYVKKISSRAVISEMALARFRSGVWVKRRITSLWPAGSGICIGAVQGSVT